MAKRARGPMAGKGAACGRGRHADMGGGTPVGGGRGHNTGGCAILHACPHVLVAQPLGQDTANAYALKSLRVCVRPPSPSAPQHHPTHASPTRLTPGHSRVRRLILEQRRLQMRR